MVGDKPAGPSGEFRASSAPNVHVEFEGAAANFGARMEDRAIVSEVELVAIVNETLSKSDALDLYCRDCRARGFYRLAELDALGKL